MTATASEYIWGGWTSSSYTTYTSSDSSGTWQYWNTSVGSSTTTATTDSTWRFWVSDSVPLDRAYVRDTDGRQWIKWVFDYEESVVPDTPTVDYQSKRHLYYSPPKKSTEQIRAERVQREINRIWQDLRYQELQAEKEAAEEVAMEMLGDLIGDDQLKVYRETGRLLVHGKNHDWLLRKGGIIAKVEKGKLIDHCVHLKKQHSYPPTDNVITLALRLKDNDKEVEKIANRHSGEKSTDEILRAANF